ncbi:hypothetical protein INR49_003364 [Caranx melampygus]|nr:hypothetical protein INR49_003364 [Caranx melampygus]
METQVDTILMPRSFHSCLLTKLNSRLALQAVIQRDRSISNCISPTTSSAFPLLVFSSLTWPSSSCLLESGRNVSGPFALSCPCFRANYREMEAVREKGIRLPEERRALTTNSCLQSVQKGRGVMCSGTKKLDNEGPDAWRPPWVGTDWDHCGSNDTDGDDSNTVVWTVWTLMELHLRNPKPLGIHIAQGPTSSGKTSGRDST